MLPACSWIQGEAGFLEGGGGAVFRDVNDPAIERFAKTRAEQYSGSRQNLTTNVILLVRSGSRIVLFQAEPVLKGARNQESPAFLTNAVAFLRLSPKAPTSQFQKQSKPLTLNPTHFH